MITVRAVSKRKRQPKHNTDTLVLGEYGDEWIVVTSFATDRPWMGHLHTRHKFHASVSRWGREEFYQYSWGNEEPDKLCSCGKPYPENMMALVDIMRFWWRS